MNEAIMNRYMILRDLIISKLSFFVLLTVKQEAKEILKVFLMRLVSKFPATTGPLFLYLSFLFFTRLQQYNIIRAKKTNVITSFS